ncbi:MAG: prohibitin family protein, partial [Ferruginibacter sp.]
MFLVILGIIIFIATGIVVKNNAALSKFAGVGRIIALLIILLGISTACIKQIDAGEVGVKKLFGSIQPDVLASGLHFVNPLLEVDKLDIKTQNY